MSENYSFEQVASSDEPLLDVVFVHGLTGDASQTWQSTGDSSFWPTWLLDDINHIAIYTLGYPASLFEKWAKKEMDIFERAGNVLERFAGLGIGERPIAFVTHSLGGILTKILIRRANDSDDEGYNKIAEATRLIIFLSTPHTGASLASAIKILPGASSHIALLANETGFLNDLNDHYRAYAASRPDLATRVYYEKHATKKIAVVVKRESADPGVAGAQPVALDKDHLNICKPVDKDDTVYLGIKRHIESQLDDIISDPKLVKSSYADDDYASKFEGDRRDLLQKLIDANREHEYPYANDAQNSFARSFTKTGLFTAARHDHELLLAEVETRFMTHIYHPLICKGAPDEDIREALQTQIVDPLAAKAFGGKRFSPKTILSALYYLTEQCHIKWDATI